MSSPDRVRPPTSPRSRLARIGIGLCGLLVAGSLSAAPGAVAAEPVPTATVNLGKSGDYSVLAGAGVANTGAATVLAKDLGLSPAGVIAGFPPGVVKGAIHDKDAAAAAAQDDRAAAYDEVVARPSTTTFAGDQIGKTFGPGVHSTAAAFTNTGTMTLDAAGDSGAVFIFQVGAAFSSAASTKIVLKNGALANNVFWQVLGAVSIGASATVVGTFLAAGAVSLGADVVLKGRVLTPGTVALANNPITEPKDDLVAPVVSIDGGPARSTNDTTPAVSGVTDEPAGRPVTIAVAGQTLTTTTTAGGAWTVSTGVLTEGAHDVVVTVADASQNVGTASQVLTVDTVAPALAIDGSATRATNDTTPTVSGTTDAPAATPVRVTVAGQVLGTTATADGTWAVDAQALTEASHPVEVSVSDSAGNTAVARQVLDVDVTLPVITIDGGAARSTPDTSPWTYGTTGEQAGTIVRLAVSDQSLRAEVNSDGTWGVSATTLAPGTYLVVAWITDAAGNTTAAQQALTVGAGQTPTTPTPPTTPGTPTTPTTPGTPTTPTTPTTPGAQPRFRPDAAVRGTTGAYVGVGRYAPVAQKFARKIAKNRSATYQVQLTNRGNRADRLAVKGSARNKQFTVTYRLGGSNVTKAVLAGSFRTANLAPGRSVVLVVTVARTKAARAGNSRTFQVQTTSVSAPALRDVVGAVARA